MWTLHKQGGRRVFVETLGDSHGEAGLGDTNDSFDADGKRKITRIVNNRFIRTTALMPTEKERLRESTTIDSKIGWCNGKATRASSNTICIVY
jgi:hypothetical protein